MNRGEILINLRQAKPDLEARFGVVELGLFGSSAREAATAVSDVDFISKTCCASPSTWSPGRPCAPN